MTTDKKIYTLSITGPVTVTPREISEELAGRILALIMGFPNTSMQSHGTTHTGSAPSSSHTAGSEMTPKAFMANKRPASEQERLTCLAYYLTYHRGMPAFKTRDLSRLNTEAAQPAFSNPTAFARNADIAGYLAKAGGGQKQISSLGEAIVEALPDRSAVQEAIAAHGRKKSKKSKKSHSK